MSKENAFATSSSKRAYVKPETSVTEIEGREFMAASANIGFGGSSSSSGGSQLGGGDYGESDGSEALGRESVWNFDM